MSRFTILHGKNRLSSPVQNYHAESRTEKENKSLVYLTCIYIFAWYLQLGNRIDILGTIRFEFLLGSFLVVCAIIRLLNDKQKATPLRKPIVIFFSILVFYTIFSYDHSRSWEIFYERVLKFSMLALFFTAFIRTTWALKLAITAFLLAMMKLGQEGFVGWLTGSMIWENQGVPRLHGQQGGLYGHPNSFSGMAVGCLPFIYYFYPIANKIQKLALAALGICCIVIIVFTGSRTGYVATGLLIAYFWWEKKGVGKLKFLAIAALLLPVILFLLPPDYIDRFISIFTLEEKEGASSETRLQIIEDALNVFLTHPLGVGVSAFPSVRMEMFGRYQDTHNLYLELLTNLSLFGFIAFGYFIVTIVRVNRKVETYFANNYDLKDRKFLIASAHAIIAFVYTRLFLGLFGMDTYEIYWWFAAGTTMALWKIKVSSTARGNITEERRHRL